MTSVTSPHKDYVYKQLRFTQAGEEVQIERRPSTYSLYGLACCIKAQSIPDRVILEDIFHYKIRPLINDVLCNELSDVRPSSEGREAYAKRLAIADILVRNNISGFITRCLKNGTTQERRYAFRGADQDVTLDELRLNKTIFLRRIQESLTGWLSGEGFRHMHDDYVLCKEVSKNPQRYEELEVLCERELHRFARDSHVRGMDEEAQLQEGRLVIWHCASKYEGRNFARFSSLVRAALKNKRADFLNYFYADCRRVNKMSCPGGSGSERDGSPLADVIARSSFAAYERDRKNPGDRYRADRGLRCSPNKSRQDFEERVAVFADCLDWSEPLEIVDDDTFPRLSERRVRWAHENWQGPEYLAMQREAAQKAATFKRGKNHESSRSDMEVPDEPIPF